MPIIAKFAQFTLCVEHYMKRVENNLWNISADDRARVKKWASVPECSCDLRVNLPACADLVRWNVQKCRAKIVRDHWARSYVPYSKRPAKGKEKGREKMWSVFARVSDRQQDEFGTDSDDAPAL